VPEFSLVDQDGRPLGLSAFRGRPFVIDFIYTKCNGPCPMMSAQMRDLHRKFEGEDGLRFLTVSVDPRNDTPEALRDYAEIYEALPGLWIFATGTEEEILRLERDGLKLNTGSEAVEHSTHFVLVDGEGWVRGYYDGREDARVKALETDLRGLLARARP
jgi:protein SCO1/2